MSTIYAFDKSRFTEEQVNNISGIQCEEMYHKRECDKLPIYDFLHHLNNGWIPVEQQIYVMR